MRWPFRNNSPDWRSLGDNIKTRSPAGRAPGAGPDGRRVDYRSAEQSRSRRFEGITQHLACHGSLEPARSARSRFEAIARSTRSAEAQGQQCARYGARASVALETERVARPEPHGPLRALLGRRPVAEELRCSRSAADAVDGFRTVAMPASAVAEHARQRRDRPQLLTTSSVGNTRPRGLHQAAGRWSSVGGTRHQATPEIARYAAIRLAGTSARRSRRVVWWPQMVQVRGTVRPRASLSETVRAACVAPSSLLRRC